MFTASLGEIHGRLIGLDLFKSLEGGLTFRFRQLSHVRVDIDGRGLDVVVDDTMLSMLQLL